MVGRLASGAKVQATREPTATGSPRSPVKSDREVVDFRAYVYVALMVVLGSTTAAAAKIAVAELPVTLVPAARFGMAGLCLLPWVLGRGVLVRMFREDALLLLATAALCVPINQGFFLTAARLGPTSHVGIFYATCPLVVLLLAWTMRMERPDRGRLWGVLASVAGIVVIGLGNFWSGRRRYDRRGARRRARRPVAGRGRAVVGRIHRGEQAAGRASRSHAGAGGDVSGRMHAFACRWRSGPGRASRALASVSSSAWLALVILGLFITPLGWAFQNLSLRRFDASQVATFSNGSPFLTVVWGVWLFSELLTPALMAGGALTLGGIYWASRSGDPFSSRPSFRLEQRVREAGASGERHATRRRWPCAGARPMLLTSTRAVMDSSASLFRERFAAMSKPFDATMRKLLELEPAAWLRFLQIPVAEFRSGCSVIDSNLSTITAEADKVLMGGRAGAVDRAH